MQRAGAIGWQKPEIFRPKETLMSKRWMISLAAVLLACSMARAQDSKPAAEISRPDARSTEKLSKKAVSITGTVSPDGLTLVADKETKIYKVLNPDFVIENAGQHVRVSARVNKENTELLVSSVIVQDAEPVVANKGDSAFRR
jgi:hypothetical protein